MNGVAKFQVRIDSEAREAADMPGPIGRVAGDREPRAERREPSADAELCVYGRLAKQMRN